MEQRLDKKKTGQNKDTVDHRHGRTKTRWIIDTAEQRHDRTKTRWMIDTAEHARGPGQEQTRTGSWGLCAGDGFAGHFVTSGTKNEERGDGLLRCSMLTVVKS